MHYFIYTLVFLYTNQEYEIYFLILGNGKIFFNPCNQYKIEKKDKTFLAHLILLNYK